MDMRISSRFFYGKNGSDSFCPHSALSAIGFLLFVIAAITFIVSRSIDRLPMVKTDGIHRNRHAASAKGTGLLIRLEI